MGRKPAEPDISNADSGADAPAFVLAIIAGPAEPPLTQAQIYRLSAMAAAQGACHLTLVAACEAPPDSAGPIEITVSAPGSGRAGFISSIQCLAEKNLSDLSAQDLENLLSREIERRVGPEPDLVMIMGGARDLSGSMTWTAAYSEFVFLDEICAELSEAAMAAALASFRVRERRFGGLNPGVPV